MIVAIFLALVAANSPVAPIYDIIHHIPIHLRTGPFIIDEPLIQWINEGLMVFFFLFVGLEIKRQFLEGHLSTTKRAVLPAFAALGGMLVPAAIYVVFNVADPIAIQGWAIPTATDIVLALGILSLLGSRVPAGLKVFLTAIAIFDDIGAVLIIGIFYGESVSAVPIIFAGVGVGGLVLLNIFRVGRFVPYIAVGLFLWVSMLKSGVEASLAGILISFAIPIRISDSSPFSPLREAERRLHPFCVLVVGPLFAFFNAGILISINAAATLLTSAPLGFIFGLFIGKQVGIFGAVWMAARLNIGELPHSVGWLLAYAVGVLAGIGFTMSLFVATLAFSDAILVAASKLAILLGSILSAVVGVCLMLYSTESLDQKVGEESKLPILP